MASNPSTSLEITLEPADNARLANLCGQFDEHIRLIEQRIGVEINNWGSRFQIIGAKDDILIAQDVLQRLYNSTENTTLSSQDVHLHLQESRNEAESEQQSSEQVIIKTRRVTVKSRGANQREYLTNIQKYDLNFGVGPAGTGKTYLAVLCAVDALEKEKGKIRRIILTRPAVEAGERLGFLPGDLAQKIDPYLRPLYDALYDMLGFEKVHKLIERNVIEIAPLAYMRGRTLNDAYIILDEAQNTTIEQMKMFLTRIGFGSKAVVTGDVTQVDLPGNSKSGLRHVISVLKDVPEISFTFFKAKDVVRHPLVQRIVTAYAAYDDENSN